MSRAVLQIPIQATLRQAAEKQALEQGFSSLQEAVRVFLKKLANGAMNVTFAEHVVLSSKNAKRYNKMLDKVESGKVKTQSFTDVDDLMKHLTS